MFYMDPNVTSSDTNQLNNNVEKSRYSPTRIASLVPGVGAAALITAVATYLGHLVPIVGAPVFAILIGALSTVFIKLPSSYTSGIRFTSRTVLQTSVVLLGLGLSLSEVLRVGATSLPVLAGTLVAAIGGGFIVGRLLKIEPDISLLISVGTGICGASAIAAMSATIAATESEIAYSIATIFTFNVAAVLTFPLLGHLIGMSPRSFGLFAGTAVNDMSSVVAAATVFSGASVGYAVIVKLTRTLAIVPLTVGTALIRQRRSEDLEISSFALFFRQLRKGFPPFILFFLVAVAVSSVGIVPTFIRSHVSTVATVMITGALAAIGLSTRFDQIRRAGFKPLAMGAILWIAVAGISLSLQTFLHIK